MKMQVKDLVRVFVKGGVISPGDFLKILLVAENLGAEYIQFGSRQDILFPAKEKSKDILDETFLAINTDYEINTFKYQNVVSSYAALDILPGKQWLASHTYQYILKNIDYRPRLRINVVDPSQSLVPLFTGEVNFIASNQENYWFVYLHFKELETMPWQFPSLIYTDDLMKVARALENLEISKIGSYQNLITHLNEHVPFNALPVTENLVLPETHFPYYEGIHRQTDGKYWLGLYWRNNQYRIETLKAMMEKCIQTESGKVTLTSWKSFIIKGIHDNDRIGWEKLMGKFGMNLRHSSLELNWHLPALDQNAMDLKFYLVRELDMQDISTYGLTFTIKNTQQINLFTSVVIERSEGPDQYNILYSKDFNPNIPEYQYYAENVHKTVLAALIQELSLVYYENITEEKTDSHEIRSIKDHVNKHLYQCVHCQTIYDEEYGDVEAGIPSGTSFTALSDQYSCPTCGGKKSGYQRMVRK